MNGATLEEITEIIGHKTLQKVHGYEHLSEAHTEKVLADTNRRKFGYSVLNDNWKQLLKEICGANWSTANKAVDASIKRFHEREKDFSPSFFSRSIGTASDLGKVNTKAKNLLNSIEKLEPDVRELLLAGCGTPQIQASISKLIEGVTEISEVVLSVDQSDIYRTYPRDLLLLELIKIYATYRIYSPQTNANGWNLNEKIQCGEFLKAVCDSQQFSIPDIGHPRSESYQGRLYRLISKYIDWYLP